MRLDQRLRRLKGDNAALPPEPAPTALAKRLERLSLARRRRDAARCDEAGLAERLGAESVAPGVLRLERRIPMRERHGRVMLGGCLQAIPCLLDAAGGDAGGWVFLDTETSGLAGGTGTWAFLCGLIRPCGDVLLLRQYLLTRLDTEPAYLDCLEQELNTAELFVTYNGKSFDLPLLTTRLRLSGRLACLTDSGHLDLLFPVRRAFKSVWPDCRLVTAESRLLAFGRQDDLPGSEAPAAWLAWLRRGEPDALAGVLRHNCWDLLSLVALPERLALAYREPHLAGADIRAVAAAHRAGGAGELAYHILQANQSMLKADGLLDLARLYRARGELDQARSIWESLALEGHPAALETLAKDLEHGRRNYQRALELARRLPEGMARDRRCRRLEAKLGAGTTSRILRAGMFETF